jgi:hypothetical protein
MLDENQSTVIFPFCPVGSMLCSQRAAPGSAYPTIRTWSKPPLNCRMISDDSTGVAPSCEATKAPTRQALSIRSAHLVPVACKNYENHSLSG